MSTENKVFITPEGEHDYNQKYEQYSIVTHTQGDIITVYLAIKPVPPFIAITDKNYWKFLKSDVGGADISGKADKVDTPQIYNATPFDQVPDQELFNKLKKGDIIIGAGYGNVPYIVTNATSSTISILTVGYSDVIVSIYYKNNGSWFLSKSYHTSIYLHSDTSVGGQMLPNIIHKGGLISNDIIFGIKNEGSSIYDGVPYDKANIWYWTFETGSTVPSITWPSVTWCDSADTETVDGVVVPIIEPNKHYEISIMNGYGTIISADIPETNVEP